MAVHGVRRPASDPLTAFGSRPSVSDAGMWRRLQERCASHHESLAMPPRAASLAAFCWLGWLDTPI